MSSFGEELRRQRELRDISLREIADATKINIRFLEALEQDDFKHLPGGQFNKGFIRAYSRHIGVDAEGMVDSYLHEMTKQDDTERASGKAAAPHGRGLPARRNPAAAIVIALLVLLAVGVLAGTWYLRRAKAEANGRPARAAASSQAGTTTPGPPPAAPPSLIVTRPDPDAAAQPSGPREAPRPSVPAGELALIVLPTLRSRLEVLCNGSRLYSGALEPGRTLHWTCPGVFEISMDDAGAASITINGDRVYLGRPGQAIAGRHVSAANYLDFAQPPAGAGEKNR